MSKLLTRERIDSFEALRREIVVFGSGRRLDDEADALAILSEPDVVLLHWPSDQEALDHARERHQPRFLVVEELR